MGAVSESLSVRLFKEVLMKFNEPKVIKQVPHTVSMKLLGKSKGE